jgi:hypothetical protein
MIRESMIDETGARMRSVAFAVALGFNGLTSPSCGVDAAEGEGESVAIAAQAVSLADPHVVDLQVPAGGSKISAAIYQGRKQKRTLYEQVGADAGAFPIEWNGLDDFGKLMPAGSYTLRSLTSLASVEDEGSVGQIANPSWGREIHSSNVHVVATDPLGNVYEASPWAEFGQQLRSWTSTGEFRWGGTFDSLDSILGGAIAADMNFVYVAAGRVDGGSRVLRFPTNFPSNNAALQPVSWSGQPDGYITTTTGEPGHAVFGLAVDANTLWVSNFGRNVVQRFDKATGAFLGEFAVFKPHGLAADLSGNVWVTHGPNRATLFGPAGFPLHQMFGLQGPFSVAIRPSNRHLYIGEAGSGEIEEYALATSPMVAPTHLATLFGKAQPGRVRADRLRWPDTVDPQCGVLKCRSVGGPDGPGGAGGGFAVAPGRIVVADPGNYGVVSYTEGGALQFRRLGSGAFTAPQVNASVDLDLVLSTFLEFRVEHGPGSTHGQWSLLNN